MHRFNTKLFVGVLLVLGVASVGVSFLHASMVRSNAGGLLKLADKAKEEGKLDEAVHDYRRYKQYRPDDPRVYSELALIEYRRWQNEVNNRRFVADCYKHLNDAAGRDPDNFEVRHALVAISIAARQWSNAIEEIQRLAKLEPNDTELDLQLARCYSQSNRADEAIEICNRLVGYQNASGKFEPAAARDARKVDAYVLLAQLLRRRNRLSDPALAAKVMEQMVAANPGSSSAHLLYGQYLQQARSPDRDPSLVAAVARKEFEQAIKLAPDDPNAIVAVGDAALMSRNYGDAQKQFEHGIRLYPRNELMYIGLAHVYRQTRQADSAEATLKEGLKHKPDSAELMLKLIDLQIDRRDAEGARGTLTLLGKLGVIDFEMQVAQARLLMIQSKWLAASKLLEDAKLTVAQSPEPLDRVLRLLSDCYEGLGQPDRQMDVANQLIGLNPRSINAQIAMASAMLAQGKVFEALSAYENVEKSLPTGSTLEEIPVLWQRLFRLRIAQQMNLPKSQQDWKTLDEMVERMKGKAALEPADWAAAAADLASFEGHGDRAREILIEAQKSSPTSAALWLSLSNVVWRQTNDAAQTLEVLDQADRKLPNNVQLRMQRLALIARAADVKSRAAVAALAREKANFSEEDDQLRWLEALGYAQHRVGDSKAARETWRQLAGLRKDDLVAYLMIFDLSTELKDDAGMKQAAVEIHKLSGDDALYHVVEAKRIATEVQNRAANESDPVRARLTPAELKDLANARTMLLAAKQRRPNWYEIPYTLAKVEVLSNNPKAAIEDLRQSLDLGVRSPDAIRQLAVLLASQGQDAEALKWLGKIPSDHGGERDRMEATLLASAGRLDQAIELANQLVPDTSKAANDLLWQGQLLARANKNEEAEAVLRRAVKAAPDRPEMWLSLVKFFMENKRLPDAQKVLADAKLELPADQVAPTLARGYQMAGMLPAAEQNFLDYLGDRPDDLGAKRDLATFYLQFHGSDSTYAGNAEARLKDILRSTDPHAREFVAWARRELAILHAPTADYPKHLVDLASIRQNAVGGVLPTIDQSLIADLQADRPDALSRRSAIRGYEALQAQGKLNAIQTLRLAQLYEQTGRWDDARTMIQSLLGQGITDPRVIVIYSEMLLRHGDLATARVYIDRFKSANNSAAHNPASIGLQARLLAASGKGDEAAELLDSLVARPVAEEKSEDLRAVAQLLEQLKLYPQAEKDWRAYVAIKPAAMPLLVRFLAQHDKLAEAMDLCAAGQQDAPNPTLILACIEGLHFDPGHTDQAEQFARIERWINDGLKEDPKSLVLTSQLAALRQLQGRFDDCEKLYRRCLDELNTPADDKAKTANNLAFLLATIGKSGDEALQLVDQAIQAVGPQTSLLDTRAMVYLAQGDTKNATQDMRLVLEDDSQNAINYLHLAAIQLAQGQTDAAQASLKTAQEKGLDAKTLNPLERVRYDKLMAALKK